MPRKQATSLKTANLARTAVEIADTDADTDAEPAPVRNNNKRSSKSNAMKNKANPHPNPRRPAPYSSAKSKTQDRRIARLEANGLKANQKTLTQIGFLNPPPINHEELDLDYIPEAQQGGEQEKENTTAPRGRKRKTSDRGGNKKSVGFAGDIDMTLTQMYTTDDKGPAAPRVRNRGGSSGNKPKTGSRRNALTRKPICELDTIAEETEPDSEYMEGSSRKKSRTNPRRRRGSNKADTPTIDLTTDGKDTEVGRNVDKPSLKGPEKSFEVPETQWTKLPIPVTPKKFRRLVVPSSQSPDSPEITFRSQNIVESPSRSPLKAISYNTASGTGSKPVSYPELKPKRLWPISPQSSEGHAAMQRGVLSHSSTQGEEVADENSNAGARSLPATPSSSEQRPLELHKDTTQHTPLVNESSQANSILRDSQEQPERVIGDSEDESEDDGFHDAFSKLSDAEIELPQQPSQRKFVRDSQTISESSDINNTQGVPVADPSDDIPQSTVGSELSILYCRMPMSYHWNAEDIPDLSSTGLAELFATQGDLQPLNNFAEVDEDPDTPLELVPESPLANPRDENCNDPPSSPVILVKSSQTPSVVRGSDKSQVGEGEKQQQDSSPRRGRLTASQLLTESLMESIPAPPGWMSSQMSGLQEEDEIPYPSNR